jgi:glutamyl-tRNA synthetase
MPLIKERAKTLAEIPELVSFFFRDENDYEPERLIGKKMAKTDAQRALEAALEELEKIKVFDIVALEGLLRPMAEELGLKTGQFFGTLRVAVTGRTVSPPLFETMAVLGSERCLERIHVAIEKLG